MKIRNNFLSFVIDMWPRQGKDAQNADVLKNNAPKSDVRNDDLRDIDVKNDDPQNEELRRNNGDVNLEKEERWDKDFFEFLEEFASVEKRQGNKKISYIHTEIRWPVLALSCKGSLLKVSLMSGY